jgi:hypothetical protein
VLDSGDNPVVPLPYAVRITEKGVGVSFSAVRRRVTSKRIGDTFDADLTVGATEEYTGHCLTRYDNLTATVVHELKGGSQYETHLVRGSPYQTFSECWHYSVSAVCSAEAVLSVQSSEHSSSATCCCFEVNCSVIVVLSSISPCSNAVLSLHTSSGAVGCSSKHESVMCDTALHSVGACMQWQRL